MVILTGPTGSGKSTTLVAALYQVISPEVNVLTVEDPVEYVIEGARQLKIGYKMGFEQAIRSILRHDPDIVLVGEMRDKETAEIAIKLANTGHLTFLHFTLTMRQVLLQDCTKWVLNHFLLRMQ